MSDSMYYYSRDRQTREGPVSLADLQAMAQRGVVLREHLVWTDGMGEWVAAGTVAGLFGDGPPPVPPMMPSAAPEVHEAVWVPPEYAGFWLRFVAAFIDGLLLTIPSLVINGVVAGALGVSMFGTMQQGNAGPYIAYFAVSSVIGLVMGWLYFALMESSVHQATLGKMALGLRVTTDGYERLSFGRATGRHFAKMVSNLTFYIGYIMAGFTERKQALHDMIAGCLVVRKR